MALDCVFLCRKAFILTDGYGFCGRCLTRVLVRAVSGKAAKSPPRRRGQAGPGKAAEKASNRSTAAPEETMARRIAKVGYLPTHPQTDRQTEPDESPSCCLPAEEELRSEIPASRVLSLRTAASPQTPTDLAGFRLFDWKPSSKKFSRTASRSSHSTGRQYAPQAWKVSEIFQEIPPRGVGRKLLAQRSHSPIFLKYM